MTLYVTTGGWGAGSVKKVWVPGDPGHPTCGDTKDELLQSPGPEVPPCSNAECINQTQVYVRSGRGYWYWTVNRFCRRCYTLRSLHSLELPELIALWEAQNRCCYQCSKPLADPRLPQMGRKASLNRPDGTSLIRIDHDHRICPKASHSCVRCRRGLACNGCNCQELSVRSRGMWILPQGGDLRGWLEFLGPEDRDRLRKALTAFPEQPVRKVPRRRSSGPGEVIPLFDLGA